MKNLLSILALFPLLMIAPDLPASVPTAQVIALSNPIHPRDVNRLLKIAAAEWNLSVGQARQAYNAGNLTLTRYPQAGVNVYMIVYDGFCILAALEDKF
jgi:hypothetical protein